MSDGDSGGGSDTGSDSGSSGDGSGGDFEDSRLARWGCAGCSVCDACSMFRLSPLLLAVAAVRPPAPVVLAGIGFYRRRLTRFTPRCPSTPSCSAYAVDAVARLGTGRGLVAAARRIRACMPPTG